MTESLCFQEGMEAPNFSRTLEPLTVKEHEPATFRVFYSGCPRPEVTWMRYTFPIEDSDAHQIHTTGRSNWILQRKWKYHTPLCKNNPPKLIVFWPIFLKMADLAGCG